MGRPSGAPRSPAALTTASAGLANVSGANARTSMEIRRRVVSQPQPQQLPGGKLLWDLIIHRFVIVLDHFTLF